MRKTKYIETKSQLIAEVEKTLKPVLEEVGKNLLYDLEEQIKKDIYLNDYFPNMRYYGVEMEDEEYGEAQPSLEFLYAWSSKTIKSGRYKNSSTIEIKYDPSEMTKKFHKSITDGRDVRKWLHKILNVDGYTSSLMAGQPEQIDELGKIIKPSTLRPVSKLRKPYWNNFIKKIKSKSLISKYMKQEAKKLGVNLV